MNNNNIMKKKWKKFNNLKIKMINIKKIIQIMRNRIKINSMNLKSLLKMILKINIK